jgi:hypothetical protein
MQTNGGSHPADSNVRTLEPESVAQVQRRFEVVDAAIRAALAEPTRANLDAVIDAARWARFDVDAALAMKGHVPDLRDEHWATMKFTTPAMALSMLENFVATPLERLDLVAMRNLRARLTGVLAMARGLAESA